MKDKHLKLLWVAQGYLDAQIAKNYLLSYDIETILYEESLGTLYGFTNTPLGDVEIYVKNEEYEKALQLIKNTQLNKENQVD